MSWCPTVDKRAEAALLSALDGLGGAERVYFDWSAPAVYRIEPEGHEAMVLACYGCRTVAVVVGTPTRATSYTHGCGAVIALRPPQEVIAHGNRGRGYAIPS